MPRDAADTRAALLEAGRHLFATEGVYSAPLSSIIKAAGQRNSSALQYHFADGAGDARQGLLFAIVLGDNISVEAERQKMLDDAVRDGRTHDLAAIVRVAVLPLAHKFADLAGREFLAIISQMVDHFNNWDGGGERMPSSAYQTFRYIEQALPADLVPAVRRERVIRFLQMTTEAIGSHARYLNSIHDQIVDSKRLTTSEFLANLIDMAVGALMAPVLSESSAPGLSQQ